MGSLVTACIFAVALPLSGAASAADLDGEGYAEPPYDDGSYRDDGFGEGVSDGGYGEEGDPAQPRYDRYGAAPSPDRYREPYDAGEPIEPRQGSIKDGYPVPMPPPHASAPPPRYGDTRPPRAERYACLDRWQIKRRLRGEGWSGIRPVGGNGGIVHMRARRFDSSSLFGLRVDRCSGAVLAARPLGRHLADRDWRRDRRRW
jgi:hypothetical protein